MHGKCFVLLCALAASLPVLATGLAARQTQARGRIGPTYVYGNVETEAGARDVQILVAEQSAGSSRYVPRKPTALKGRSLPDLGTVGTELPADATDRMLLVCFGDMNQRPSRHCVTQLARQAAQLEVKGVAVVLVQAAATGEGALEQWAQKNGVPFAVGRIAGDVEKTRFDWGAVSLPHLILTDKKRKVVAEGFNLSELDGKIEAAAGR